MKPAIRRLRGSEIASALADLAALRIAVFADWPYLYDGTAEYEADYLREFAEADGSVVIAAFDDDRVVGAATASPMWKQKGEFRAPFEARGLDTRSLCYFGESVLLPAYRGRGIGRTFFDERERHARSLGATGATFAAVIRQSDDPRRPGDYLSLEAFWRRRGYAPIEGVRAELAWKEHGEADESAKPMQYWIRAL